MKKMTVEKIALCGLFAALTAVFAQISIPIGPVPISFANVAVFVSAGILGGKFGAICQLVYVLAGAVGMPVFAGFMGGAGRIAGPTGGFIIAYVIVAFVVGKIIEHSGKRSWKVMLVAMYIGWIIQYGMGTAWYCIVTGAGAAAALSVCVVPFLIGDLAKTVLSIIAVNRLRKPLSKLIVEEKE